MSSRFQGAPAVDNHKGVNISINRDCTFSVDTPEIEPGAIFQSLAAAQQAIDAVQKEALKADRVTLDEQLIGSDLALHPVNGIHRGTGCINGFSRDDKRLLYPNVPWITEALTALAYHQQQVQAFAEELHELSIYPTRRNYGSVGPGEYNKVVLRLRDEIVTKTAIANKSLMKGGEQTDRHLHDRLRAAQRLRQELKTAAEIANAESTG